MVFKKGHKPHNTGKKLSDSLRDKISMNTKEAMNTPEMKIKMSKIRKEQALHKSPWNKGLTKDTDERVKKSAEKQIGKIVKETTKTNMSINRKGKRCWNRGLTEDTDERVKKYAEKSRKTKKSDDFKPVRKKMSLLLKERRKTMIIPMTNTSIEIKIHNFLDELKIEYFMHKYISEITHAYQCDFFIPVQNKVIQKTIIECDGDYWHCNPIKYPIPNEWQLKQIEEDKIRTNELTEKGFRVIRLWEQDIKKMELNEFLKIL